MESNEFAKVQGVGKVLVWVEGLRTQSLPPLAAKAVSILPTIATLRRKMTARINVTTAALRVKTGTDAGWLTIL